MQKKANSERIPYQIFRRQGAKQPKKAEKLMTQKKKVYDLLLDKNII